MDNRAIEHIFYSIENNLNTNDYINIIKEKFIKRISENSKHQQT